MDKVVDNPVDRAPAGVYSEGAERAAELSRVREDDGMKVVQVHETPDLFIEEHEAQKAGIDGGSRNFEALRHDEIQDMRDAGAEVHEVRGYVRPLGTDDFVPTIVAIARTA